MSEPIINAERAKGEWEDVGQLLPKYEAYTMEKFTREFLDIYDSENDFQNICTLIKVG